MTFDPEHSELERDPAKLGRYVQMLQDALADDARIVGILEIGSYAKGEAVPSSDIDSRVFVVSPRAHFWQTTMGRWSEAQLAEREQFYARFVQQCGKLPRRDFTWLDFNQPVADRISAELGMTVEFGLADARYAEFEFQHLDASPMENHALIFQSNVIYDPDGMLAGWRQRFAGIRSPALVEFYRARCLDHLPFEIYAHLKPETFDSFKIAHSRQIQWVKWAVRCLRDAVAASSFIATGQFVYKKLDVIEFYRRTWPEHLPFVERLYNWKTDPQAREQMVEGFLENPERYFALFRDMMPELELIVRQVACL